MSHTQHRRHPGDSGRGQKADVPLNIWPVAQATTQQRAGRYPVENRDHPGTMLPELARRIITECSLPGELVADPRAGSGTTLVESAALGRRCVGVEQEPDWAGAAERHLDHVLTTGQRRLTQMRRGDARRLSGVLGDLAGQVDLVVTSPPYANATQKSDIPAGLAGGSLSGGDPRDDSSEVNIGRARERVYRQAMTEVYAGCFEVLRPGGALVTVTTNTRQRGRLLDLAGWTVTLARQAGFVYMGHIIALHAGIHDGELVAHPSLWRALNDRKRPSRTPPLHAVVHQDVLVFTRPQNPGADPDPETEGDVRA